MQIAPNQAEPTFAEELAPEECALIREELDILERLREHFAVQVSRARGSTYDEALLELRDTLGDAQEDEVAQIVAQMSTLAHLSAHDRSREEVERPFNPRSPYFGHLRIEQEGRVRDVLIGNRTLVGNHTPFPIIDWRNAPISRVFYTYREGDEYEEELGGRTVEGTILAHRRLVIHNGELRRIVAPQGTFLLREGTWRRTQQAEPELHGGAGTALRPASLGPPELGVGADDLSPDGEGDKRLRPITDLIDEAQFELITRPDSGVVVIDGGAGSGKTTIALHRIAYLAWQDPQRFKPEGMLCMVFNKALASYVAELLPALGVSGVRIAVFEDFVGELRSRHYPHLPVQYAESTPSAVMHFKQHPAAWTYLAEVVAQRAAAIRADIASLVANTETERAALQVWDAMSEDPLALRLQQFAHWVWGKRNLPPAGAFGDDWVARQRLRNWLEEAHPEVDQPQQLAVSVWLEAFLHLETLRGALGRIAPDAFSTATLEAVRDRAVRFYGEWEEYQQLKGEQKQRKAVEAEGDEDEESDLPAERITAPGEGAAPVEPPRLDREDDTLLLLLYRHMVAPLRERRRRPMRVQHLTVDEAQDFSPLDLRVLIGLNPEPHSVTLAGDTDQRMILHNSFTRWEDVLSDLGLPATNIAPLRVGYRSTEEIMHFARGVLGPLSTERPWVAVRRGAPVELLRFYDQGQAVATLAEALRRVMRREPNASVALLTRYHSQAELYYEGLTKADIPRLRRVRDQDFTFRPGVEVTDVQQVKGLEFDYVLLLDVDADSYPDETAARYLLHIGATRAAHQLWLVSCREPSPILPEGLTTHEL